MTEKIILITGSTDGIGKQTALALSRQGAQVILHGRNPEKVAAVADEIHHQTGGKLNWLAADFSSLTDVRRMAAEVEEKYPRLDVLINNAGTFAAERLLTVDGYELTFAVNHLAPFLLTNLLLPMLRKSAPARIVTVTSMLHAKARVDWENLQGEKEYRGVWAYNLSKLGNVLFTVELSEWLRGSGVTANCLHPGAVETKMLHTAFPGFQGISIEEGAKTSIYLASAPEVEGVTGCYFENCRVADYSPLAADADLRRKFWELSERMTGL